MKRGKRQSVMGAWLRRCAAGAALAVALCHGAEAPGSEDPDRIVSRFRIGPLFEYRERANGELFWALRPLYSRLRDPVEDLAIDDPVWPLCSRHQLHEESWWRFLLLAYGSNDDVNDEMSGWKGFLFPLYFQGRTRQGEDYWALFPIYGHIPHILMMEDIDFTLFPLYLDYEVNGIERRYYGWPFYSRGEDAPGVVKTGVFPFYGETERRDVFTRYVLWPIWTSATYASPRNPGKSWMLWPLMGRVDREREQQTLFLPPFFSHAKTDSAERWRMPWPFYETYTSKEVTKRSYWPLYGRTLREDEDRWYALWPLIERFKLDSRGKRTERFRFFPFYMNQKIFRKGKDGSETLEESYTRFWPFYSVEERPGYYHLQAFEFIPIRFSQGIDRNWAPFWTLYERTESDGRIAEEAFWGLFKTDRERLRDREADRREARDAQRSR
ncbi:MAG: hypothetical protein J6334_05495 [Kiritimatiellae bacterium]|nr:hypothetical protein [Kiritimatiellia bacterium]